MNNLMAVLVVVCLVCLVLGMIKPGIVIKWGDNNNRNRKNAALIYGLGVIIFFLLFGITMPEKDKAINKSETTASVTEADKVSDNSEEEEKQKITDMEQKYETMLMEAKDYANMTNEEGNLANEMVANWSKLSDEYKAKYNENKDKIASSINTYNANKKAEEEARKAEEEAQKAAEEAASYNTGITYDQLARTPDDYKEKKVTFSGKVIQVMEDNGETDLRIVINGDYNTVLLAAYDPSITSTRVLENDNVTIKGKSKGLYTYKSTIGGKITVPLVLVDKISINK